MGTSHMPTDILIIVGTFGAQKDIKTYTHTHAHPSTQKQIAMPKCTQTSTHTPQENSLASLEKLWQGTQRLDWDAVGIELN